MISTTNLTATTTIASALEPEKVKFSKEEKDLRKIEKFLSKFDENNDPSEQLKRLFSALSKILQDPSHSGKVESILKDRIFSYVNNLNKAGKVDQVIGVISSKDFKYDSRLTEVIVKANYLVKDRKYRFLHHLQKNLGNFSTMSKGAAFFSTGMTMLVGIGLLQSLSYIGSTASSGSNTTANSSPDQSRGLTEQSARLQDFCLRSPPLSPHSGLLQKISLKLSKS